MNESKDWIHLEISALCQIQIENVCVGRSRLVYRDRDVPHAL